MNDNGAPAPVKVAQAAARATESKPAEKAAVASKWVIQLGATDDEAKARDILARARAKAAGPLADASPFTEVFVKGGATYHRARFGGFASQDAATRTCAALKKRDIACYATQR